jgi:hypothetical protein
MLNDTKQADCSTVAGLMDEKMARMDAHIADLVYMREQLRLGMQQCRSRQTPEVNGCCPLLSID